MGLALALAPLVLQMFSRGPGGAAMLADFRPYMDQQVLTRFQADVDQVDAASKELQGRAPALAASRLGLSPAQYQSEYAALVQFEQDWPAARDDLTVLIRTIEANIGNYGAVAALPSFRLFPYFFVLPGLMIAAVAALALRRRRRQLPPGWALPTLALLGVGLILAPLVFQMFTRAPKGEEMLNQFRPLMTTQRITTVQGYFVTMAGGEAAVRAQLLPALRQKGASEAEVKQLLPQSVAFTSLWTSMVNQMAPMLAAMNDNLTRYQGLIALPPFGWFPYFFMAPGLLLLLLAAAAGRTPIHADSPSPAAVPAAFLPREN